MPCYPPSWANRIPLSGVLTGSDSGDLGGWRRCMIANASGSTMEHALHRIRVFPTLRANVRRPLVSAKTVPPKPALSALYMMDRKIE